MRRKVDQLIEFLGVIALLLMVLACIWQVFSRYVLKNPSGITEEFMRYALIWTSLIGAPYAFGKGKHLSIIFAVKNLPPRSRLAIKYIVDICVLLFAALVLIVGGIFVSNNAVGQISAALGMPMQFLYLASPLSGVLFIFYLAIDLKDLAEERKQIVSKS